MSVDKAKDTSPKSPVTETKIVEPKTEPSPKTENARAENKPEAAPTRQSMGEGQKPVSKAYKDNWNDIFAKKKKR